MQTFRLCEQQLDFKPGFAGTCNLPSIDAIKVLSLTTGTSATPQKPGASRSLLFGGGHLRVRYNSAIIDHNDCPCSHAVHMVSALAVLPLLEDDLTPAYLPNLTRTRTFDSVVLSSQSDQDEDILWWHDDQLDITNAACIGGGATPCIFAGTDCSGSATTLAADRVNLLEAHAGALYGRATVDHRVRVKRRLKERQALFFLTEFFSNVGPFSDCPGWPFRRNVYLRYAVR
jgi:hypothetical protein